MIKRAAIASLLLAATTSVAHAEEPKEVKTPSFISLSGNVGSVLQTTDCLSGEYAIPLYSTQSLKYGFTSAGDKWQHIAYGMPYYGIGVSMTEFGKSDFLGNPLSIYLLQGATISNLSKRLALNYEFNLGMSSGWKPYDPFTNPNNTAIGSVSNVHVAANVYLKWYMSNKFDLNVGGSLLHFSNGSSRQPNSGVNTGSIFFELAYNFNRDQIKERYDSSLEIPDFEKRLEQDVQFIVSSKNIKVNTEISGMPTRYNAFEFNVFGFNYYLMRATNYKYKYGGGVEVLYDESSNVEVSRTDLNGQPYDVCTLAPFRERLSVGVSVKGEIVMPLYSIFANIGYSMYHPNKSSKRLYQTLGVKIPLKDNLYGTFGIRANHFSSAQFLYWSLGYTIAKHKNNR